MTARLQELNKGVFSPNPIGAVLTHSPVLQVRIFGAALWGPSYHESRGSKRVGTSRNSAFLDLHPPGLAILADTCTKSHPDSGWHSLGFAYLVC